MKNLVKADFYYQMNNKKVYIYAALFLLVYATGISIGNIEWASSQTLYSVFKLMINQEYLMMIIIVIGISCYYQGMLFKNRFIMYQNICYGCHKTIISKVVVQTLANCAFISVVLLCSLAMMCIVYDVQMQQQVGFVVSYFLLILLMARFTVRIIVVLYSVKNGVIAAIIIWMINVAEMMPLLIGNEYKIEILLDSSKFFLPGQIYNLAFEEG